MRASPSIRQAVGQIVQHTWSSFFSSSVFSGPSISVTREVTAERNDMLALFDAVDCQMNEVIDSKMYSEVRPTICRVMERTYIA